MVETKCIYGDCEYVEEQLNQYLNDGWNVLDMKTTLYRQHGRYTPGHDRISH